MARHLSSLDKEPFAMDLDRTSLADPRAQDLRARNAATQERLAKPPEASTAMPPAHGGPVGNTRPENGPRKSGEAPPRERRRSAMATVVEFLSLPADTEIDIEVDLNAEQVAFLIRDRQTGELLRQVPEGDAQTLVEKLREFHGSLVDRSL